VSDLALPLGRGMARPNHSCALAILTTLLCSASTATAHDEQLQLTRVKPADPEMRRLVLDGYMRSSTFSALVDELQRSNAIIVIQFGTCANGRVRSCVSNVDGDERQRHIRIKVNTRTTDDRLIATIAHELQHATEITRERTATNSEQTLALYRRIATGKCRAGLSDACETDAALRVEAVVNHELDRERSVSR
jgi:coenzyme F420-reducing hydrogenase gamma subunit